jgi:2-polyprenyl-3-methyl-5-hydroxy-6-metoxy-1,4-benzoquinol methylase
LTSRTGGHTFEYSEGFRRRIAELHRGKESWPNYGNYLRDHLGGPGSRIAWFRAELIPEIEHRCGPLEGRRVLDFGCGTGSTTAALAERAADVCAFDVDRESLEICEQRASEHGLLDRMEFRCAPDVRELDGLEGSFDLVLLNGVLEHIPLSAGGLRESILRSLERLLRGGGHLYINDTPNRLWPIDFHSTQLWWIPWMPPGSAVAYRLAVARGRHTQAPTVSDGPLGLEEVGAWGATYWEIMAALRGTGCVCQNLLEGGDRRLHYTKPAGRKLELFERLVHYPAVRILKAPLTAFAPFLTNLVLRKPSLGGVAPDEDGDPGGDV